MELGKVAEKLRESTERGNGRTKRGLLRAWRFQGKIPGGGRWVSFDHLSFLQCVGQEHVFRIQIEETAVKVRLNCCISPDPWGPGVQAGKGQATQCGPPEEGDPVSMMPSCSKWSCGPCDPCPRFCLLPLYTVFPALGWVLVLEHDCIAAVAPFLPLEIALAQRSLLGPMTLGWQWPQEGE